jgi:hypothetical protein
MQPRAGPVERRRPPMKGLLLWMIGIPLPVILLLYLFGVMH